MSRRPPEYRWSLLLLVVLVVLGIALDALGLFDPRAALERLREWPAGWLLAMALIIVQTLMFMLALPGSAMVWVVAVLYPPAAATLILTAGGTAGAWAARAFSGRVASDSAGDGRVVRMLERQGDFFTLCAVRLLPGFPHSLINYAAGTLGLPLGRFLLASAIGFAVKAWLYSTAIHGLAGSASADELLRWQILLPLVLLAALAVAGRFINRRWIREDD